MTPVALTAPGITPTHPTVAVASPLVVPLHDARDEQIAGGKAAMLARLIALEVPVPDGMVLTCQAFDQFLQASGLEALIERRLSAASGTDFATLQKAADEIRALVLCAVMPGDLTEAFEHAALALSASWPLAVRSSAVGEDGARASFAGQFDSVLHVHSITALQAAVRECWASYWSARALFYRHRHRMPPRGMALLIQRQVDAHTAGVLFTQQPGDHAEAPPESMVIEYVAGLADRLVSGQATPHRLYVSRRDRTCMQEVRADEADAARLTTGQVQELAGVALRLEQALGGAQDIEWAIDGDGHVAIVQSRPITTGARPASSILWSNANVNENFPDPVSPLLYSIACAGYRAYFRNLGVAFGVSTRRLDAMEPALRTIVGAHGARLYYNLTHIHAVLRMAPFGDRLAAAFNLFVGAGETADQPADARRWQEHGRLRQTLALIRIVLSVVWQFLWLPARLRTFEHTADAFAARTTETALAGRSLAQLGTTLMAFVDIRCRRWKNASLCDTAAMVCYAALRRTLAREGFGDATHTRLLRAIPGVPSSQPAVRLWELSRLVRHDVALSSLFRGSSSAVVLSTVQSDPAFTSFRRALERYLDEWGFRSSGELMLTSPTLQECPEPVIDLIRSNAATDGSSPMDTIAQQARERAAEARAVLSSVARRAPFRACVLWVLLRGTQGAIVCRERARLKQALLYTRCRRVVLHIGEALVRDRRIASRDDVFMLTWQEIEELCAGRAMFPDGVGALVDLRRGQHAEASRMRPPVTFRLPVSAGWTDRTPGPDHRRAGPSGHRRAGPDHRRAGPFGPARERRVAKDPAYVLGNDLILTGAIACGGRVTARAAVLSSVREAHTLLAGDVLVTRQTDPGWAPVFCLVSALVIERGGMLSHGAIIAREFGLPCLVCVKDATNRIPHGARVTVDADAGECRVEARP